MREHRDNSAAALLARVMQQMPVHQQAAILRDAERAAAAGECMATWAARLVKADHVPGAGAQGG